MADRDAVIRRLHEKLIEWRRGMPFPLPESQTLRVPHLSTTWFDLNYHNHVIVLYRPSPLCPTITLEKVAILADASAMSIRHVATMRRHHRFSFNWLNLFTVFSTTLALIYTITAQPEPIPTYLQQSDALADLRLAAQILQTFGEKFPSALRYRDMVWDVISRLESHLSSASLTASEISSSNFGANQFSFPSEEDQQVAWTPSEDGAPAYPSNLPQGSNFNMLQNPGTGQSFFPPPKVGESFEPEVNLLSTKENLPLAIQLFQISGLFDDFAGQDLFSGFDINGSMDLDDELLNYFDTGYAGGQNEGHNSEPV